MSRLFTLLFVVTLCLTTTERYLNVQPHHYSEFETILSRQSAAPYKYRVLPALFYLGLKSVMENHELAEASVYFLVIIGFYISSLYLFFNVTGSINATALGGLVLCGMLFSGGTWVRMGTEFVEAALIALAFVLLQRRKIPWLGLMLITFTASLNRETWIFYLIAMAVFLRLRNGTWNAVFKQRRDVIGFLSCCGIFFCIQVFLHLYLGLSPYACELWTYKLNVENLLFTDHQPFWLIANGLPWLFGLSLVQGNRWYLGFIAPYFLSMFLVAFLIGSLAEFRIFLPCFSLVIASILRFYFYSSADAQAQIIHR